MKTLEDIVSRAEVVNMSGVTGKVVRFGATVHLADEDTNEKITYLIVGSHEADISAGRLSITSPLGRALIGTAPGDSVEVSTPRGSKSYEVVKVRYN